MQNLCQQYREHLLWYNRSVIGQSKTVRSQISRSIIEWLQWCQHVCDPKARFAGAKSSQAGGGSAKQQRHSTVWTQQRSARETAWRRTFHQYSCSHPPPQRRCHGLQEASWRRTGLTLHCCAGPHQRPIYNHSPNKINAITSDTTRRRMRRRRLGSGNCMSMKPPSLLRCLPQFFAACGLSVGMIPDP